MTDRGGRIGSRDLYHCQPEPASWIPGVFVGQSLIQSGGIFQPSLLLQVVGLLQALFGCGIHRVYWLIA